MEYLLVTVHPYPDTNCPDCGTKLQTTERLQNSMGQKNT